MMIGLWKYTRCIPVMCAIVSFLTFTACQKEITGDVMVVTDTLPVILPLTDKVKSYTEDVTSSAGHQVETFDLNYDSTDRIISLVSTTNAGNKFIYQYISDTTYTLDIYNQNVVSIHEEFFLNKLFLVDSTIQYNDTYDTTTEKYIYNAAKQPVTLNQYQYSTASGAVLSNVHSYTYNSYGNLQQETEDNSVTTYDYFTTFANNILVGQMYFFRNPNLTKTTTSTSGGATTTLYHTYTFDTTNRLVSEKATSSNGDVVIKTYTYY